MVLDLHQNGGGSLSEAIALTRVFIEDGPVVQVKDTRGFIKVLRTPSMDGICAKNCGALRRISR